MTKKNNGSNVKISSGGDTKISDQAVVAGRDVRIVNDGKFATIKDLLQQVYIAINRETFPEKESATKIVEKIEAEASKPARKVDESVVADLLGKLRNMAPDIFDVVATTFGNQTAGGALVIKENLNKAKLRPDKIVKLDIQEVKGKIDFGIISIRDDEFRAVLARFPKHAETEGNRRYAISGLITSKGGSYSVAIVRCPEQGEGEGQDIARDLIIDLAPNWLLLVGIAGGVPDDEFTLGDVVVATRLHDFCVGAEIEGRETEFGSRGGPMHPLVKDFLGYLPSMDDELGAWNSNESIGLPRPLVSLQRKNFYGDDDWKRNTRQKLSRYFGRNAIQRGPKVITGSVASSDKLIKNTKIITAWRKSSRQIQAIEMELAGVYQAARRKEREYPILAIRGISDIVGYKRHYDWTAYACRSAASFAYALLKTQFIDPMDSGFAHNLISRNIEKA